MKKFPINKKLHEKILVSAKEGSFKVAQILRQKECSLDEVIGSLLSAKVGENELFEKMENLYSAISGIVRYSYHSDTKDFYEKIEIFNWFPIQSFTVDENQIVEINWPSIYIMGRALRDSTGLSEDEEKKIIQQLDVAEYLDEDGWLNFQYNNCLVKYFLDKIKKSLNEMPFDLKDGDLINNVSCESNFKMKHENNFQLVLNKNDERGIVYANNLLKLLISMHCTSAQINEMENKLDSMILEGQMYFDIVKSKRKISVKKF